MQVRAADRERAGLLGAAVPIAAGAAAVRLRRRDRRVPARFRHPGQPAAARPVRRARSHRHGNPASCWPCTTRLGRRLIDSGDSCTDAGAAALAGCAQLREVNLTWCIQLTDAGLCALASSCRRLESLSVHGVQGVTDASIEALAAGCAATLHTLDVNGCTGIRNRSREHLRQLLPALTTFVVHK